MSDSTPVPAEPTPEPSNSKDPTLETPEATPRKHLWRRAAVVFVIILLVIWGRPLWHIAGNMWDDSDEREHLQNTEVDDASRLNKTSVAEVWPIPQDLAQAEQQLADLLARARNKGQRVSIGGARHSMGGHTIYPDGIVIDMLPFNAMQFDKDRELLTVGSGAKWSQIIEYLDGRGYSVAIMQSNNSFSVGGSISVNCHGWQYDRPPISSSVDAFRLMKANGKIVRCSRTEQTELFSLVLGGYGLFGVILDVDLRVVPNRCYRLTQSVVPAETAVATYKTATQQEGIEMVYARMNIVPDRLLEDVILNILTVEPNQPAPPLKEKGMVKLRRAIFRGSIESDYGKELRWKAETKLQPQLSGKLFSRNQILNEGVEVFQNRTKESTDILHEYFVPIDNAAPFIAAVRTLVRLHQINLLNVTVRQVKTDTDTFLRYADQEVLAFVMLFNQTRDEAGEVSMREFTQAMIDSALEAGGRYYLPYRLHATKRQFHLAYPQAREFFEKKREYDPDEMLQNQFYLKYAQ